jgi:hypothetical protein
MDSFDTFPASEVDPAWSVIKIFWSQDAIFGGFLEIIFFANFVIF